MPRGLHILTIASFARNTPNIQCKKLQTERNHVQTFKMCTHIRNTYMQCVPYQLKFIYQCFGIAFTLLYIYMCVCVSFLSLTLLVSRLLTEMRTHKHSLSLSALSLLGSFYFHNIYCVFVTLNLPFFRRWKFTIALHLIIAFASDFVLCLFVATIAKTSVLQRFIPFIFSCNLVRCCCMEHTVYLSLF